jgi:hypothetical protein
MYRHARKYGLKEEEEFFRQFDVRLYPIFENPTDLAVAGDLVVSRLLPIFYGAKSYNSQLPPLKRLKYLTNKELIQALITGEDLDAWSNNYVLCFLKAYMVVLS